MVVLLPLRVPPPAVVLAATATGLTAAALLAGDNLVAAALLLQLKTVLDNADGQLARASGRESVLGRYLDSESDLLVNVALFAALAHVTGRPWLALASFLSLTFVLRSTSTWSACTASSAGARRGCQTGAAARLARVYDLFSAV